MTTDIQDTIAPVTKGTSPSKPTRPERIDIGDGLIMRWSTKADAKNIADCMAECFKWIPIGGAIAEDEEPIRNEWVHAACLRLLRGNHTVMTENDYAIVENTLAKEGENPIIACTCLMTGPGYYGDVDLMFGKPEAVGCLPEYRSKGLIRRLFLEMIHPASDARGDIIQFLPGIPQFYLQFGYEYALGIRAVRVMDDVAKKIPTLLAGEVEPFTLREPTLADIPYLVEMSTPARMLNQAQVGVCYDEAYWRYTIHNVLETAESPFDISRIQRIIVDPKTGKDAGLVMLSGHAMKFVSIFTLDEGYSYREAMYPVLRQLLVAASEPNPFEKREAAKKAAEDKESAEGEDNKVKKDETPASPHKFASIGIALDAQHPVYKLLEPHSEPIGKNHRLYTRIPSYATFLQHVAPTLERRIAESCLAGITATLRFNFFRKVEGSSGKQLEVVIEDGKIISASDDYVEPSPRAQMEAARERKAAAEAAGVADKKPVVFKAEFAPLTFTRLVVGDLSLDEMLSFYSQASVEGEEAKMLLNIMFPKSVFHLDVFWW
ncbi:hypothetical protein CPB97_008709 [Podila verticillata]|nr:hypothetical protein CPB97_008709 [Podila verticillata]